jgi:hypothetical protein
MENSFWRLPDLQELTYSGSGNVGDAFTSFIDTRQNSGRPRHRATRPYTSIAWTATYIPLPLLGLIHTATQTFSLDYPMPSHASDIWQPHGHI